MKFFKIDKKSTAIIPFPLIKALVFNGGGIKGIAYVGAVRALNQENLLNPIEWVVGTSAGSLVALLLALDYSVAEIEAEISSVNFAAFKDHGDSDQGWESVTGPLKDLKKLLWDKEGYYKGRKLYQWLQGLVANKLQTPDASFDDLHAKKISQSSDSHFKDLLVTVTNYDKKIVETLGYGQKSTGRMPIADAVLSSMTIPGVFHTRYIDPETKKIVWKPTEAQKKTLTRYVDGGVLSNYSIETFIDPHYWSKGYYGWAEDKTINPSVLGLRLDSMDSELETMQHFWYDTPYKPHSSDLPAYGISFKTWGKEMLENLCSDNTKARSHGIQTVFIPIKKTVGVLDFALDEATKKELIAVGEQVTAQYINHYLKDAVYDLMVFDRPEDLALDLTVKQDIANTLAKLKNPSQNDKNYADALEVFFQSVDSSASSRPTLS
jgi:NTE family protein